MSKHSSLVYSTETGRACPACENPIDQCSCSETSPTFEGDGTAYIRKETKGRGGKIVTTVQGLHLNKSELASLGKALKKRCGTGGAVKNGVIEIQGDVGSILKAELEKKGFKTKGI